VAHKQKDKKCLRNTNILNYLPSFGNSSIAYLWLNTNHLQFFDQIACLKIILERDNLPAGQRNIQIELFLETITNIQ